jgi:hypothetical protein
MRRNPYPEHIGKALRTSTNTPQENFNLMKVSDTGELATRYNELFGPRIDIGDPAEYLQLLLDFAIRFERAALDLGRPIDSRIRELAIILKRRKRPFNRPNAFETEEGGTLMFTLYPEEDNLRDAAEADALLTEILADFTNVQDEQRIRDAVAATRPAATPGESAAKPKRAKRQTQQRTPAQGEGGAAQTASTQTSSRAKKQTQQRTPAQGEGVAAQTASTQTSSRRRQPQSGPPVIPSDTPPARPAQGGRRAQGGQAAPPSTQPPPPSAPSALSPPDPSATPDPDVVVFTCVEKNTSELTNLAARTFTNAQIAAVTDDVYNDIPGLTNPEKARAKEISETLRDFAGRVLADDYYTAGGAVFMFMPLQPDAPPYAFIYNVKKSKLATELVAVAKSPRAEYLVVTTLPLKMLQRSEQSDVDALMADFAQALVELLDQTDLDFDLDAYDILGL